MDIPRIACPRGVAGDNNVINITHYPDKNRVLATNATHMCVS